MGGVRVGEGFECFHHAAWLLRLHLAPQVAQLAQVGFGQRLAEVGEQFVAQGRAGLRVQIAHNLLLHGRQLLRAVGLAVELLHQVIAQGGQFLLGLLGGGQRRRHLVAGRADGTDGFQSAQRARAIGALKQPVLLLGAGVAEGSEEAALVGRGGALGGAASQRDAP
jgi:hypothetical protein